MVRTTAGERRFNKVIFSELTDPNCYPAPFWGERALCREPESHLSD